MKAQDKDGGALVQILSAREQMKDYLQSLEILIRAQSELEARPCVEILDDLLKLQEPPAVSPNGSSANATAVRAAPKKR